MRRAGKLGRTVVVLVALGLIVPACGGGEAERDRATSHKRKKKKRKTDDEAVSEEGKQWGGWRWKGRRDDCFYVFDNECFADQKSACRAAGCGLSKCEADERSAPVKVRCDK